MDSRVVGGALKQGGIVLPHCYPTIRFGIKDKDKQIVKMILGDLGKRDEIWGNQFESFRIKTKKI